MILTIFTEPTQIPPLSKSATWLLACLAHCDCKMKGPFHVSVYYYLTAVKITARIIRMWLTWFHLRSKIHDANEILAVSPLKGSNIYFPVVGVSPEYRLNVKVTITIPILSPNTMIWRYIGIFQIMRTTRGRYFNNEHPRLGPTSHF